MLDRMAGVGHRGGQQHRRTADRPRGAAAAGGVRDAGVRPGERRLLDLQRSAGNGAVTQLLQVQRAPTGTATAGAAAGGREDAHQWAAFAESLAYLAANQELIRRATSSFAVVAFEQADSVATMRPSARVLFNEVRYAIYQSSVDGGSALDAWRRLEPKLRAFAARGARFGKQIDAKDLHQPFSDIATLRDRVFVPAAYRAALAEKKKGGGALPTPDLAVIETELKPAVQAFLKARLAYEETSKAASEAIAISAVPTPVKDLADIFVGPGTVADKYQIARGEMGVTSVSELIAKTAAASSFFLVRAADQGERLAKHVMAKAVKQQAWGLARKHSKTVLRFEELGRMAKGLDQAAKIASVAVDVVKLVGALRDGDAEAVLDNAGDLAIDTVTLLAEDAAPLVGAAVVVLKAEMQAVRDAAAFIRWCRDEQVRVATNSFRSAVVAVAHWPAEDLVANVEILLDADQADLHELANQKVPKLTKAATDGLRNLQGHVQARSPRAIGAYRAVTAHLGDRALQALAMPQDDVLTTVQQLRDVFEGTNRMIRHVKQAYTN
jgi:hypothetical protein